MLLVFICALGFYAISILKKETFPTFTLDMIEIGVPYPGAGPEEVEKGILIKIEESLTSIQGIDELRSVMEYERNNYEICLCQERVHYTNWSHLEN